MLRFGSLFVVCVCLLTLLAPIASAQNAAQGKPQVWFSPSFAFPGHPGSADNLELFKDSAPWVEARKRVSVFKVAAHTIADMSDSDLENMLGFLNRNHIDLAIEYGMLTPSDECGRGVEGFSPEKMPTGLSNKIKKFGGQIRYIAMDEPLYYGQNFNGKNACHWTVEAIAQSAAPKIKQFRDIFPNVEIGDIEPVAGIKDGNWIEEVRQWIDAYRRVTGVPLAFFHDDMIWRQPIAERTRALTSLLDSHGIKFGVIFNSRGDEKSDEDWFKSVKNNINEYRSGSLKSPDHVIIQSWQPHPTHVLPESNPYTLTHLVNYYFTGH